MWISPTGLLRALSLIHTTGSRSQCSTRCRVADVIGNVNPMSGAGGVQRPLAVCIGICEVTYGKFEAVKGISLDIPQGESSGLWTEWCREIFDLSSAGHVESQVSRTGDGVWAGCTTQPQRVRESDGLHADFLVVYYEDLTASSICNFLRPRTSCDCEASRRD